MDRLGSGRRAPEIKRRKGATGRFCLLALPSNTHRAVQPKYGCRPDRMELMKAATLRIKELGCHVRQVAKSERRHQHPHDNTIDRPEWHLVKVQYICVLLGEWHNSAITLSVAPFQSPAKPRVLRSPLLDPFANADKSWEFQPCV